MMAEDEEPTQRTEKDAEIPIPKRGDFFKNLKKAAKPKDESSDSGTDKQEPEGS